MMFNSCTKKNKLFHSHQIISNTDSRLSDRLAAVSERKHAIDIEIQQKIAQEQFELSKKQNEALDRKQVVIELKKEIAHSSNADVAQIHDAFVTREAAADIEAPRCSSCSCVADSEETRRDSRIALHNLPERNATNSIKDKIGHAQQSLEDVRQAQLRHSVNECIEDASNALKFHENELKHELANAKRADYLAAIKEKQQAFQ